MTPWFAAQTFISTGTCCPRHPIEDGAALSNSREMPFLLFQILCVAAVVRSVRNDAPIICCGLGRRVLGCGMALQGSNYWPFENSSHFDPVFADYVPVEH